MLEVAQLVLHENALGQPLAAETRVRSEETRLAPAVQGAGPGSAPFPLLVRVLAPSLFTGKENEHHLNNHPIRSQRANMPEYRGEQGACAILLALVRRGRPFFTRGKD